MIVRSTVRLVLATCAATAAFGSIGVASAAAVAKGQPDPSFGSAGFASVPGAHVRAVAVQSDGKVILAGDDGATPVHLLIERLNTNGSVDSSFNGGHALGAANTVGRAVAIQSDGKIVVAGAVTDTTGATPVSMLAERFNSNGSADGSFGSGGVATALGASLQLGEAFALGIQADGKVVLGGQVTGSDGFPRTAFARFSSSGHLDGAFGSGGVELIDFGRYSEANSLAIQSDGKIVFTGSNRANLQTVNVIAGRLNTNGSVDASFAHGAFVQQLAGNGGGFSSGYGVALQPDGKVVIGGAATDGALGATALAVRLTSAGALDGSFGSGGITRLVAAAGGASCGSCSGTPPPPGASAVAVSGGEVALAGYFDQFGRKRFALWGLNSSGHLDTGFGSGGLLLGAVTGSSIQATSIAVAPGGNFVVGGFATAPFSATLGFVGRFGGPAVAPPPPPKLQVKVSVSRKYKISTVTGKSGLKISVNCSAACKVSGSITVSFGTAKALKLAPRHGHPKTVTIARGSTTLRNAGNGSLTIRFSKNVAKALSKQKSVSATLATSTKAGSTTVKKSNGFKLTK